MSPGTPLHHIMDGGILDRALVKQTARKLIIQSSLRSSHITYPSTESYKGTGDEGIASCLNSELAASSSQLIFLHFLQNEGLAI